MSELPANNPYASPQTEQFVLPVDENVLLQARFINDESWQRKVAYELIMPGGLLLTSSLLVLVICMALGAVFCPLDAPGWSSANRYVVGAGLVGFPAGAVGAIWFHIVAHRFLQRSNLKRLRAHSVLSSLGEWLIEVDTTELRIQTSTGMVSWPLTEIWWHPIHRSAMLLLVQAPGPLPIGVPRLADLEPPLPSDFSKLLRLRVRRLPFT